jgi:hypothetical protein
MLINIAQVALIVTLLCFGYMAFTVATIMWLERRDEEDTWSNVLPTEKEGD